MAGVERPAAAKHRSYAMGLVAFAFYAAHAAECLLRHHPEDLLWVCNVASLGIAVGLFTGRTVITAPAIVLLAAGTPLWIADLAGGSEFIVTSVLTHVGSLALGLWSIRRDGIPRHTWWRALAGMFVVQQSCRWLTPRAANVNMAFDVYGPALKLTRSYPLYWSVSTVLFALAFFAIERLARRLESPASRGLRTEAIGS